MIPSKSIHVVSNGKTSFSFVASIPLLNPYHIVFLHSSVDEHLGCFHILAIVNNAAVNTDTHVSSQISVFVLLYTQE